MSEVVPVENLPENVSRWERFHRILKDKLFDVTEQALSSMADFQKELVKHLTEMTELNSEIAKMNAGLAMKLSDFERDICHIRDYYDRIVANTKSVVNYGSNQAVIPHIKDLIEEKRYPEAKTEIKSFLICLKNLMKRVERAIEEMHEDCPEVETVKNQIKESIFSTDPTKSKQDEMQVSHYRIFRLGASTLVYTIVGAATGMVVASCMPQESAKLTEVITSAGSEALSFYTGSVLQGFRSVMDTSNLSNELRKRTESSVIEVCRCLTGFFEQLNRFQSDITTIEKTMDDLKLDMDDLQDEPDGACNAVVSEWTFKKVVLQQMFESFTRLSSRVIERPIEGFGKEEFDAVMERLNRSVELTTLGTPV